ncbi:class I adenylate-forming enzyme family protein [Thermocrispum sp.]|uniref:class I adenylate-forming enzyme family protein n=1 Tax=Thermocrispum sp. TaxID=2060768 RepID=UPI00257A8AE4|nr:class I adenylate-forming enzyme family protein [Thermocrispum sp.]
MTTVEASPAALWGTDVVRDPGSGCLLYEPRPRCITDMLAGTHRWADRTYLVQGERRIDFRTFLAAVPRAAGALPATKGERVMVLAYNSPEFVLALWAIWWAGLVPVLGNRWWSDHEIAHAVALTEPALVLSDRDAPAGVTNVRWRPIADLRRHYAGTGTPADVVEPDDELAPGMVLFTSGSSGPPKAVVLAHRSVVANQHNLLSRSRLLPQTLSAETPQQVMLACTPFFHVGGVSNLITQLIVGGRLVMTAGRFDAGEVLELIEREKVHRWGGVPTMAARVLAHPDFDRRDLSSLRSFPLGGAQVPEALLERMRAKLPQLRQRGLANTWGMTESGGFVTVAGNRDLARFPGTVGRPYPVAELRIDDPDDSGRGEIMLRSPTVMLGYLGADDGTVDADGWLRTGDIGRINDEGYLFLTGRAKDIVIRGGENIACAHVERALLAHPDVVEAAVFGLPHEDLGEELAAAVTCRAGTAPTEEELRAFLRRRLAHFEVPTTWRISDAPLPTLAGEKVDKKALRAELTKDGTPCD